jgi:opacity protein-like surface antigen
MKKMITAAVVTVTLAISGAAQEVSDSSEMYVGIDLLTSGNTFDHSHSTVGHIAEWDNDSKGFKLKLGSTLEDNWRLQGYLLSQTYDTPIFDYTNDRLTEVGIDVIKAFPVNSEFSPFVQGGIGYGMMDLDRRYYTDDAIDALSFKIGGGILYKLSDTMELTAGLDLQYRSWADIEYYGSIETDETTATLYIGTNFHF